METRLTAEFFVDYKLPASLMLCHIVFYIYIYVRNNLSDISAAMFFFLYIGNILIDV